MFVINIDAHRTEFIEKLGPACLHRMSEGLLQVGVSRTESVFHIADERAELVRPRILHPPCVTQVEVVHRLGAITQVQRGIQTPIDLFHIVGR